MIAEKLAEIEKRISMAAARASRNSADITLVGVSKHRSVAAMLDAYAAGLRCFGENRVEELAEKSPEFLAGVNPIDLPEIHMIGHVQSRKVAQLLPMVSLIHSVDSVKLAQRIDRMAEQGGLSAVNILLQCNVSGEASKSGFAAAGWQTDEAIRLAFLDKIATISGLKQVRVLGLMTMAPIVDDSEAVRPVFASLRKLMSLCAETFPHMRWQHLSMGMTDDFEIAVEEGATLVRVGRAIFAP